VEPERVTLLLAESGRTLGGTERVVWELATRLPESRYALHVWLSDAPGVDELESRWDWRGMLATWRRLRRIRPRLLHLHHVWPSADRYLHSLARSAGVPHVVITEHIVGYPNSGPQRVLKRAELEQADAVTTVCGAVADSLQRDYHIGRNRLKVVPNGADLPDEDAEWPAARAIRAEMAVGLYRPLGVCAARLEEQKGHDVLLDALAKVREKGLDFVVAIAGEGSRRDALEHRARDLGLGARVRFLGQVEHVGALLLAADTVIVPSRWEGLPLTLLEAMARARPVVASAVGGIPEAVEDGVSGRLVPPGDPLKLAAALEDLHGKPDLARQLGAHAAERVRQKFTWSRVVEAFEAVYDDVLGLAGFSPAGPKVRAR
jgi:glycosyltransferase involved in cell wall biosynthesis